MTDQETLSFDAFMQVQRAAIWGAAYAVEIRSTMIRLAEEAAATDDPTPPLPSAEVMLDADANARSLADGILSLWEATTE